jgi:hypothetical protein
MNFDYKNFELELKEKTKIAFNACVEKLDIKDIAGFALYSDESAMTISASCNTYENLKRLQNKYPGSDVYFKWTPGEWKYELVREKEFQHLCTLLRSEQLSDETEKISAHVTNIYSTAVNVLEELRAEGLFENMNDDFVLMFGVSDFSDHKLEISFVRRLNSKVLAEEFEQWIVTQEE